MRDHSTDPRVTARPNGGWDVATNQGTYHVLDNGVMGWGVHAGPDLGLVPTAAGPAIGAANADELIAAVLEGDDRYTAGVRDGAAVHRGEKTSGYNDELFTDPGYRKGLQDGRTDAIDKELTAAVTADQQDIDDDTDGM